MASCGNSLCMTAMRDKASCDKILRQDGHVPQCLVPEGLSQGGPTQDGTTHDGKRQQRLMPKGLVQNPTECGNALERDLLRATTAMNKNRIKRNPLLMRTNAAKTQFAHSSLADGIGPSKRRTSTAKSQPEPHKHSRIVVAETALPKHKCCDGSDSESGRLPFSHPDAFPGG